MLGHDRRELAAIFIGGALGTVARAARETFAAPDHRRLRLDGTYPKSLPSATLFATSSP
jgi:fluoride ion exporter CrcB/FEX